MDLPTSADSGAKRVSRSRCRLPPPHAGPFASRQDIVEIYAGEYLRSSGTTMARHLQGRGRPSLSQVGSGSGGFPGAPNRRGAADGRRPMVTRAKLIATLSLLTAAMQFAGIGAVSLTGSSRSATEYFCCCAGECHCTADCCNHAPARATGSAARAPRVGAGVPVIEAPRSCGSWTGTLNRSPESPRALPAVRRGQRAARPDQRLQRLTDVGAVVSSHLVLRESSPRAPPSSASAA